MSAIPEELRDQQLDDFVQLSADLLAAVRVMRGGEARDLVDGYYQVQEMRKSTGNQLLALREADEPSLPVVLPWLHEYFWMMEKRIKQLLGEFAEADKVGQWSLSIHGIGPVISAGLLAHIDIEQAPTVGHIWSFAGLNPEQEWKKGEKRPWNARLKTLCVRPDCMVTTKRGHIPIKDVNVGDEVLTHLGRWRRVIDTFTRPYRGSVYGLRGSNSGNQVAWLTSGHPVLSASVETWRSGRTFKQKPATLQSFAWHPVEAIEARWHLQRPILVEQAEAIPAMVLQGVTAGENKVASGSRWHNVIHPRATGITATTQLNDSLMRLFGLYIAEGHVNRNNVTWSFHEDEHNLHRDVYNSIQELTTQEPYTNHNRENRCVQITIGCKPLATWFQQHLGCNSHSARYPSEWLSLPNHLLLALWNGVMDGDGDHKGKSKNHRISTCSSSLARQLVDLARRLGYSASLHSEKGGKAFRVYVNKRNDQHVPARETLIEDYEGPVYNLEVEEDHSYVVEGYAVHNCWKIGESFVKQPADKCMYRGLYDDRKEYEQAKNEAGDYADQAAVILEKRPGHAQARIYAAGKLPDGHINMRCKRWTAKIFLAHWHHVAYEVRYGEPPPKPYVVEHLGHADIIKPPNW